MTDQQPLDPAAIMAAHAEHLMEDGTSICDRCPYEHDDWPCEPYRLAAALAAAQEREADAWDAGVLAEITALERREPLPANPYRAALAGECTGNQPRQ